MSRARTSYFATFTILFCLFASVCPAQTLTETSEAVRKTMEKPGKLQEWKEADIYGGKALLTNEGNFAYWVKDGVVYAASGLAKGWSPTVPYSPPSVGLGEIKEAVGGKSFSLPPHLPLSVWEVPGKIAALHADGKKADVPVPAFGVEEGKAVMVWHAPKVKGEEFSRGEIWLTEAGGLVTKISCQATLSRVKDEKTRNEFNRKGGVVLMTCLSLPHTFDTKDEATLTTFQETIGQIFELALPKDAPGEGRFEKDGILYEVDSLRDKEKQQMTVGVIMTPDQAKREVTQKGESPMSLPEYDSAAFCVALASNAGKPGSADQCIAGEKDAKAAIEEMWENIPQNIYAQCLGMANTMKSYIMLRSCIEKSMEKR